MSHIRNTRPYHGGARKRPDIIDEIHEEWARENGYRPQATSLKLQAKKAASHTLQAPSSKLQAPSRKRQARQS